MASRPPETSGPRYHYRDSPMPNRPRPCPRWPRTSSIAAACSCTMPSTMIAATGFPPCAGPVRPCASPTIYSVSRCARRTSFAPQGQVAEAEALVTEERQGSQAPTREAAPVALYITDQDTARPEDRRHLQGPRHPHRPRRHRRRSQPQLGAYAGQTDRVSPRLYRRRTDRVSTMSCRPTCAANWSRKSSARGAPWTCTRCPSTVGTRARMSGRLAPE